VTRFVICSGGTPVTLASSLYIEGGPGAFTVLTADARSVYWVKQGPDTAMMKLTATCACR
jgi:hypothetical protein